MAEDLRARRAEARGEIVGKIREEAVEEPARGRFIADLAGERFETTFSKPSMPSINITSLSGRATHEKLNRYRQS